MDLEQLKEQLAGLFKEKDQKEIMEMVSQYLQYLPLIPSGVEILLSTLAQFKTLITTPHEFATQLDIDRFNKYINDGKMSRDEALSLTLARLHTSKIPSLKVLDRVNDVQGMSKSVSKRLKAQTAVDAGCGVL